VGDGSDRFLVPIYENFYLEALVVQQS
jgi:hypothetical protein